jgi:glycosyltransferase involved in cell wall biosynthesis
MAGKLQFLEENLDECVGLDVEVLLVHDHYEDATCNELKEIAKKVAPNLSVKILETDSRGVSGARNLGLKFANGTWIAFVDSDDRFVPSLYVEMVLEASKREKEIALGNFSRFNSVSKVLTSVKLVDFRLRISYSKLGRNPGLWRWAFLSSRISQCHFKPLELGEDLDFLLQVNPYDQEIHFSDASIYSYSTNFQGQATSNPQVLRQLPKILTVAYETCTNSHHGISRFNAWTFFWIQARTLRRCGKLLPLKSIAQSTYWLISTTVQSKVFSKP